MVRFPKWYYIQPGPYLHAFLASTSKEGLQTQQEVSLALQGTLKCSCFSWQFRREYSLRIQFQAISSSRSIPSNYRHWYT